MNFKVLTFVETLFFAQNSQLISLLIFLIKLRTLKSSFINIFLIFYIVTNLTK